jgi:hypothetical protein
VVIIDCFDQPMSAAPERITGNIIFSERELPLKEGRRGIPQQQRHPVLPAVSIPFTIHHFTPDIS